MQLQSYQYKAYMDHPIAPMILSVGHTTGTCSEAFLIACVVNSRLHVLYPVSVLVCLYGGTGDGDDLSHHDLLPHWTS